VLLATLDVLKKHSKTSYKLRLVLECDECHCVYLLWKSVKHGLTKKFHFCTRKCLLSSMATGGLMRECIGDSLERSLGARTPFQSSILQEKARQTLYDRHGVTNAWQIPEVKAKAIVGAGSEAADLKRMATNEARYGVPYVMQNDRIRHKAAQSHRRAYTLVHWKTGVPLTCVGSYEVAFVGWANHHRIDFAWQVKVSTALLTRHGKQATYTVDAFIKSGEFAGTWIEVKGWLNGATATKWEWFHAQHPHDSQLWDKRRMLELSLLIKDRGNFAPNALYMPVSSQGTYLSA
jgi:hypothetical protein